MSNPVARLLTFEEAAEIVVMSVSWIKGQVRAGRLPIVSLGTRKRITPSDLEAFIEGQRVVKTVGTPCVPGQSPADTQINYVIEKTMGVSR